MDDWVWDDAAATRWAALKARLRHALLNKPHDQLNFTTRRLLDNWRWFSWKHHQECLDEMWPEAFVHYLGVREQLDALIPTLPAEQAFVVQTELVEYDEYFMSTTRNDDEEILAQFREGSERTENWWWTRRPIDGELAEHLDRLIEAERSR